MDTAFLQVFQPVVLIGMMVGIFLGLLVGVLPGLTVSLGMILLLPFTLDLSPVVSLALLLGLYQAGFTGGAISGILINIPGTPSAAATTLDGYPMAAKGEAERAIRIAITASLGGGIIGLVFLVSVAPLLAKVALKFGAPEQFALVFLGLVLISGLSERSMLKGLISAVIGLIITTIGMDPLVATPRFDFGLHQLKSGVLWLPVMLGAFAIPTIIDGLREEGARSFATKKEAYPFFIRWGDLKRCIRNIVTGGFIGTGVGIIPGANAPVAVFLNYEFCRRRSRHPEEYGKGIPEGVAACESADNAVGGGAMIPLLTLGIPGDTVTAVLLGAFAVHGLSPGPMFFQLHPDLVYSIFMAFLVVCVLNYFVVSLTSSLLASVLKVHKSVILSVVVVLCVIGSYAFRNNYFDVGVMFGFGVLAYFMRQFGYPAIPMILALILGPMLEENLRLSIILSGGNLGIFFKSPIAICFFVLSLILFFSPFIRNWPDFFLWRFPVWLFRKFSLRR